jgi:hypothetical protein
MALPSSGPISIGDINVEKGVSRTTANTSLQQLTSDFAGSGVDQNQPYAISEFYGKSYGVYYTYVLSNPYDDSASACTDNDPPNTIYTGVNIQSISDVNTGAHTPIFYSDQALSSRYSGNSKWYRFNNSFSIQLNNNGEPIGVTSC